MLGPVALVLEVSTLGVFRDRIRGLLGKLIGFQSAALKASFGLEVGNKPPSLGLGFFRGHALHLRAVRVLLQFFLLAFGRGRLALRNIRPLHTQPKLCVLFRVLVGNAGLVQVVTGLHVRDPGQAPALRIRCRGRGHIALGIDILGLFHLELERRFRVGKSRQEFFRFGPAHGDGLLSVEKLVAARLNLAEGGHFRHDLGHIGGHVLIRHALQIRDGVLCQE